MTARHFNDAQPIVVRMSQPSSCGVASEINAKLFRSNFFAEYTVRYLRKVLMKSPHSCNKWNHSRLAHNALFMGLISLSPSFSVAWLFVFESSYENNSCLVLSHACIHIKFDLPRDSILEKF